MTTAPQTPAAGFAGLGVAGTLVAALHKIGATTPTPIQHQAIPVVLQGTDVIGIAQTGTGKTFAFGLPMIQIIAKTGGMGLVVLPTRELALQVDEALRQVARGIGLRTAVLIGGEPMPKQLRQLHAKPHIIIATPGRLNDHLEQKTVRLDRVVILVLDEADRMLDMGFLPQIERILKAVPTKRQTMLFSATMPAEITRIASRFMQVPVRIEVVPPGTTAQKVEQELIVLPRDAKPLMLVDLLKEEPGTVLIFMRTKHHAKKLTRHLNDFGFGAEEIHSNRSLAQRKKALQSFKTGVVRVLVATDIAARGIDVTGIALVVNYDLPDNPDDYVHRIGRTARAGRSGKAVSFATPDQMAEVRAIERLIRKTLTRSPRSANIPASVQPQRPGGRVHGDVPRGHGYGRRRRR